MLAEALAHRGVVGLVVAAEHEPGRRALRDDVGGRPALPDDAVDPGVGRSCWRHSPTEVNSRISASSAFLPFHGSDDGVGLEAVEDDVDVLRRERLALDVVAVARVVQQRRVEPLEQAVVDHDLLAAPPLLGRACRGRRSRRAARRRSKPARSRHRHPTRPSCCGRSRGRARAGRRTRRGSRSAGRRRRGHRAGRRGRRWQAAGRVLDGVPVAGQRFGDPGRGVVLLERRLGVGVDPVRQVEDLVACRPRRPRRGAALALGVRVGGAAGDVSAGTRPPGDLGPGSRQGSEPAPFELRARSLVVSARRTASPRRRRQGDHEQRDRQLQQALQPQDHEDRDDDADPRRRGGSPAASRPGRRSGDAGRRPSARRAG